MAEAGQERGAMDVLAGYIEPPINEDGGVRFTVREHVMVTASLEGRREGGAMVELDNIALPARVRFPGRSGQTVTILLEQMPERGARDELAVYIVPPMNENGGVRFTVRERVTVTAFLNGELEAESREGPIDELNGGVRIPGRPGQTVTILLQQIPWPEFKDGDAYAPTAAAAAVTEPSASKTDEEPGLEESSEEKELPPTLASVTDLDVPGLFPPFKQKVEDSPSGKKKEKTPVDAQSDADALLPAVKEYEVKAEAEEKEQVPKVDLASEKGSDEKGSKSQSAAKRQSSGKKAAEDKPTVKAEAEEKEQVPKVDLASEKDSDEKGSNSQSAAKRQSSGRKAAEDKPTERSKKFEELEDSPKGKKEKKRGEGTAEQAEQRLRAAAETGEAFRDKVDKLSKLEKKFFYGNLDEMAVHEIPGISPTMAIQWKEKYQKTKAKEIYEIYFKNETNLKTMASKISMKDKKVEEMVAALCLRAVKERLSTENST